MNRSTRSPLLRVGRAGRPILISLGMISLGVGILGIFLPGLPTTVFVLIASYLFARSSPRLHRRLRAHPALGRYVALAEGAPMPRHAVVVSLAGIWGGTALSLRWLGDGHPAWRAGVAALGLVGTAAVLTVWLRRRRPASRARSGEPGAPSLRPMI